MKFKVGDTILYGLVEKKYKATIKYIPGMIEYDSQCNRSDGFIVKTETEDDKWIAQSVCLLINENKLLKMKFKKGDIVQVQLTTITCTGNNQLGREGQRAEVIEYFGYFTETTNTIHRYSLRFEGNKEETAWSDYGNLLLVKENKIMDLREKFVLSLTKEPKKSFRKTGITDGDDLLTTDGQNVFLSWLLHSKYATDFKKDVVDDLLKEQKKEEKK